MGGFGSTRWKWHRKKLAVEEARTLRIKTIYSSLQPGHSGLVAWVRGQETVAFVNYSVFGVDGIPISIRLNYIANGQPVEYSVYLAKTSLPWGGNKYWFICPNLQCLRRATTLHLVPGSLGFFCRICNNLTYTSCQESGDWDGLLKKVGAGVFGDYPYITGRDARALLEGKSTPNLRRMAIEKILKNWVELPDPYSDYLKADELCRQSSLSPENLRVLNEYRLLVPEHDDKYRPKLIQWAKKLAYLLDHGWKPAEIKRWASGRFRTKNPKQWPPKRARWQS